MVVKPKILFWLNGFFSYFVLAYFLQSKITADFYGLIDVNSNPKKFFQNQKFVDFKKIWFYHDNIKRTNKNPDLEYLVNFEKTYKINLWERVLNERYFYKFNRFYQFKKEEILSILEQELKLFEEILDEIKPNYFLTYNPVFHQQKLLVDICRKRGIRVLNSCRTGIGDQTVLVENAATLDLDLNKKIDDYNGIALKNTVKSNYDLDHKSWIDKRDVNFSNKLIALKDFLFTSNSDLIKTNFTYYGKSKFNVVKDALFLEYRKNRNYNFLDKHSSPPPLNVPYVYFPMNIVEEAALLHYAPFYTDQIEVIRHIAKSIPINHILYVKEHIAAGLRFWNDIDTYKEILEIPNVKLIHPKFDNNTLIKNSKLVISIRGTSVLKAVKFGKPSITLGTQPYQIIPSVFVIDSLNSFPQLIKTALDYKVNESDYEKFKKIFNIDGFEFQIQLFEVMRNQILLSGNGAFSNVVISNEKMNDFLIQTEKLFFESVNAHTQIILSNHKTP
jgi:hypothetical protein